MKSALKPKPRQTRTPVPASMDRALAPLTPDACWDAVDRRDQGCDGRFVFAVATTGIYCRPSCPSRRAKRENVTFFDTPAAAESAGFRACKRCRPSEASANDARARCISRACRLIEQAETPPSLGELAAAVGLSPHHFHRTFKATLGVTPKAYTSAVRDSRVRDNLRTMRTVTEALHEAGFGSSARFYANASEVLGMTPKSFKAGGKDAGIRYSFGTCSLGHILVAASQTGVAAVLLGDDKPTLASEIAHLFPSAVLIANDKTFDRLVARVVRLVDEPATAPDLPLDVRGTAFQRRVWEALQKVPPGTTATYAAIAEAIGRPAAARAVARACASNRLAVVIPCHRVVRSNGELSGYRWGVGRKRALVEREKAATAAKRRRT